MFLHAGAVLDTGWIDETTQFIQTVAAGGRERAAVFRYARSPCTLIPAWGSVLVPGADGARSPQRPGTADRPRTL